MNHEFLKELICPVCGKVFYERCPQHAWRTESGQACCSYTCDRKSRGLTGKSRWTEYDLEMAGRVEKDMKKFGAVRR